MLGTLSHSATTSDERPRYNSLDPSELILAKQSEFYSAQAFPLLFMSRALLVSFQARVAKGVRGLAPVLRSWMDGRHSVKAHVDEENVDRNTREVCQIIR